MPVTATDTKRTRMKAARMKAMAMRATIMPNMIMAVTITTTTVTITMTSIVIMTMITTAIPMLMTASKPPKARRDRQAVTLEQPMPAPGESELSKEEAASLYRLMTWLSPSFPVGAFSYSSGIEWVVEAGDITDAASLQQWLTSMLTDGAGICDAIFLAHAHRAAASDNDARLAEIAELASAFVSSRERHLETTAQGRAFIEIARAAWHKASLDRLIAACKAGIVYPVAVGLVCASHHIPLALTAHAFLHAVVANWISAGARLVPLGQTDSQRVLAQLEPVVVATTRRALLASLDDLGSATFRADLAGLRHETQYTRLFRS
jgi:urease accessory protein